MAALLQEVVMAPSIAKDFDAVVVGSDCRLPIEGGQRGRHTACACERAEQAARMFLRRVRRGEAALGAAPS
jgi:hypothetical protein